jgi:hypothetical protein
MISLKSWTIYPFWIKSLNSDQANEKNMFKREVIAKNIILELLFISYKYLIFSDDNFMMIGSLYMIATDYKTNDIWK